ncbi:MAG: hypothetical protein DRN06_06715 [Thermoprotei archaeon]|nr:MAG: hypothetical protein DRN06_06715 [Thermoprotei archaeon]
MSDLFSVIITSATVGAVIGLIISEYNWWRGKRKVRRMIKEAIELLYDDGEFKERVMEWFDYLVDHLVDRAIDRISQRVMEGGANVPKLKEYLKAVEVER